MKCQNLGANNLAAGCGSQTPVAHVENNTRQLTAWRMTATNIGVSTAKLPGHASWTGSAHLC